MKSVTSGGVGQAFERVRRSRGIVTALLAGGGLLLLGLTFWAGVTVGGRGGGRPAQPPALPFGRPFGGPRGDMAHGAFGSITQIEGDSITIMDPRYGQPRTISIGPGTLIERGSHQRIRAGDLSVGERVTVIGSPMSGNSIQANFIGVVDQQPLNFEWYHAPPGMRPGGFPPSLRGSGSRNMPAAS